MAVSESSMYDVFISFRGKDTQLGFVGNLHKALTERGIITFFEEILVRGEELTPSLVEAIQHSKLFIIVFSENYASSRFCLDELVHILKFSEDNHRPVFPVFYFVDPSEVRNQTGIYGDALDMHHSHSNQLIIWRNALTQAANLSCFWNFNRGDGYEYELVEKIVEQVSKKINPSVADHPVGLRRQLPQLQDLLYAASNREVPVIGISGMEGIGKTTLARAVYNATALKFDASCFLHNVKGIVMKNGIVHLQQTLLADINGEMDIQLSTVAQGISLIKQRLGKKKVFLVLDDVTESEQLQALVGSPNWFGTGSRVIITTRDQQLLRRNQVEKIYHVQRLTDAEALELLCWKAFKTNRVSPDFIEIMLRARTYASGIPLVLEVIGSNLHGKSREECQYTLDLYENIPDKDLHKVLKISYDALDELQKEVFLAIAYFFKGFESAEIENILSAHHDGYCFKPHIGALVEKSLIKIDDHSRVNMHDLIQQMGREIVQQELLAHPRKLSRLWSTKDLVHAAEENTVGAGHNKLKH